MQFEAVVPPKSQSSASDLQLSLTGVSVFLAMPMHRDLPIKTVTSLMMTQTALAQRNVGFTFQVQSGSSLVHQARIKTAVEFLATGCTHFFCVDSDIAWNAEDFLRILAIGTKLECVGAIYPAKQEPAALFINLADAGARVPMNEYGCLPITGMGLGFTCVQRKVIEELAAKAPVCYFPHVKGPAPYLFRCDQDKDGRLRGEDMAFFDDVKALGYQPWFDPNVQIGHIGSKEYRADPNAHIQWHPPS